MSKGQYEILKSKLDEIAKVAAKYDTHVQPAVVDSLSAALIADSSGVSSQKQLDGQGAESTKVEPITESGDTAEWDFRSELVKMNENYDLSRKQFKDPEFAALLGFVVKQNAPTEHKNRPITKEHLEDACRTVDRKIPSQPASTLSTATAQGLLDKVKGQSGYTLTSKGENRVTDVLKAQDKS